MTTPEIGFGSFLGIGEEVTWGTPVSRTNYKPVVSIALNKTPDVQTRSHLGHASSASTNSRDTYVSKIEAGGSVEVLAAYDDSTMLLLKHCFGAVADGGAGPFTHTFTLSKTGYTGLTLEAGLGTAHSETFEGSLANDWELKVSGNAEMRLVVSVISETSAVAALGTPTYNAAPDVILGSHAGDLMWDGNPYELQDLSIKVKKALSTRTKMGSLETLRPTVSGKMQVTVSMTVEFRANDALEAGLQDGTVSDATVTFTGTGNNEAALTLQNARITKVGRTINAAGVITQSVDLVCLADGTNEGLKLIVTNDHATTLVN